MRLRRASALAFVLAAAITGSANAQPADGGPYWLGPSYLGLQLKIVPPNSYIYGTCDPPPDGGCVPPYDVQNYRSCERNPLTGGGQPSRVYRLRGGAIAAVQGADVEVGVGRHTVAVFAHSREHAEEAVAALRRRDEDMPVTNLPAPVYPRPVLQELKRVAVAMRELDDVSAAAQRLGMSRATVRARNAIAILLPQRILAAVRVPDRPWSVVRRDQRIAYHAQALGRRAAARRFGLRLRQVERIVRRTRGLTDRC
jgi:hypothetical protein